MDEKQNREGLRKYIVNKATREDGSTPRQPVSQRASEALALLPFNLSLFAIRTHRFSS